MSKYTAEQVYKAAEKMEREGYGSDMLREYAAHLAAQAEWPSEEDVRKVLAVFENTLSDDHSSMRTALQSVRPPVGVVSDGYKPTMDEVHAWRDRNDLDMLRLTDCVTAIEDARSMHLLASHHAPNKD